MVVEALLLIILFVLDPLLALIALGVIIIMTILYYAAFIAIALTLLIITNLPELALGALILAAAAATVIALQVITENVVAAIINLGQAVGYIATSANQLFSNAINYVGGLFNSIASIFTTQSGTNNVDNRTQNRGQSLSHLNESAQRLPIALSQNMNNGQTFNTSETRFFKSAATTPTHDSDCSDNNSNAHTNIGFRRNS